MSAVNDFNPLFTDVSQVQKELEKFDVEKAVDANEIGSCNSCNSCSSCSSCNSNTDYAEVLAVSEVDVYPATSLFQSKRESSFQLHEIEPTTSPAAGASTPESNAGLSTTVERNSEPINSNVMSLSTYQNDDFVCDVNNNDPNNNTEYEFPVQVENKQEQLNFTARDSDDSGMEFEDQDDIYCKLLKEARLINSIVPKQSLEQTYSYLETNVDCKNRVQNVMQEFSRVELETEFCNSDIDDSGSIGSILESPCQHSVENKQEQHNFTARDSDDSGMEFEDQDDIHCILLKEARLINSIVPKQTLEQTYSYLETNVDCKNRVQNVMQEFSRVELETEFCNSDIDDSGSIGSILESPCRHSVSETRILTDPLPGSSSVREIKIEKKNAVETNILAEPQPCTSSDSEMKMRALKRNYVRELCPTSKCARMNTKGSALSKQKGIKCEQGRVSAFYRPVKKSYRKAHNSSQVFENINPGIDNEIEIISLETDPNLPSIWEVPNISASSASTDQNSGVIDNAREVGVNSTTDLNKQTKLADANNECALRTNTSDGWNDEICVSETRTSRTCVHGMVDTLIPSSSTESMKLISSKSVGRRRKRRLESVDSESSSSKKKTEDFDQSHSLPHMDIATNEITLTQQQLKYKSILMEMFPDADPQYLREQCQTVETEESMVNIVTKLLERDDSLYRQTLEEPRAGPSTSSSMPDEDRVQMQYDTLVAILPNADPIYLWETCEKIGHNEDAMKTFVTQALETRMYPTHKESLKRQKALALQKKYTEQFNIEDFLEIIPDPFKYFLEEKKNDKKIIHHSLAYLKGRYERILEKDLRNALSKNHYNLTLTCHKLDNYKGKLCSRRRSKSEWRIPAEVNIPFLQEVAFIENKTKIESYLKDKADKKKRAFEEAKAKGDLLECDCCFDNEVMLEDVATCNEGHVFCKECVRKGAEVQIGKGETEFPCLNDCVAEFSLKTLQAVLKPSVFSMMLWRKQLEEVKAAGIEDLESCPFCDFASVPPIEDKVFHCLNPCCMRESCRNCKKPNHIPLRCDEVEEPTEVKVRTYIENRMTEALVRTCWKCKKRFIKGSGCNKIRCTCGAIMCYHCRKPVYDDTHFILACPLYTRDHVYVDAVINEANRAKNEMEVKNPELKLRHDPTKPLPKARGSNDGHVHHQQQGRRRRRRRQQQRPLIFRELAARGVHILDWLNRGRTRIQTALRTLANIVTVPLNGHCIVSAKPKHSSKSQPR